MVHAAVYLNIVLCLYLGSVTTTSGQVQVTNPKVLRISGYHNNGQCPSIEERERVRNEIFQTHTNLVTSRYNVITCNGISGWRKIAFINMTNTSYSCPTGLNLTSYSKRTCGRSHTNRGCSSTTFSVGDSPYSWVCGRIRGYQYGATSAFGHSSRDIESYYVDGVSLTHGGTGRRQHVWTFAAGLTEADNSFLFEHCPCNTLYIPRGVRVPAFVGDDYFCESGSTSAWNGGYNIFYANDVLWDGQNCNTTTTTCCQFNNPPWFTKNLPAATTDNIELRICAGSVREDIPLELIELYVK